MKIFAKSRQDTCAFVDAILPRVCEIKITDVSGSEESIEILFDERVVCTDEDLAEILAAGAYHSVETFAETAARADREVLL